MDEMLLWYAENGEGPGEAMLEAFRQEGLVPTVCDKPEELRPLLEGGETPILVAELDDPFLWTGWSEIGALRESVRFFPMVVVSRRSGPRAAVQALEAGANDCLPAPADTAELVARVRNLLQLVWRRRGGAPVTLDGLRLEPKRGRAFRDGKDLELTPKEFALLYFLVSNAGEVCTRREILREVWGYDFHTATNVVDVYIRHVRVKVDKGRRRKLIHTVRGIGYVVRAPEEVPSQ